ncbi:alpha/beta hydrolase [Actinoplanes regularis]|uniref:alpha/beta hydrolase n=1 Tax=Actinoplanes regularis TaxID=52697 RepID=UPI0015C636A4|nr:alpha/beta hydrolase [Actinoplanes regularis]GIE85229.1 hypothetical protein Are01nite_17090 [Actinoplanes regularis]
MCWRNVSIAELPDRRPLTLDLFRPAGPAHPCPLIIWIHGGERSPGDEEPSAAGRITERTLAAGFAVARVAYRLSGEARFPAQLHDVKTAVRWLREHAARLGLDPSRFGVWGEHTGGRLAALTALTGDDPDPALSGRNGIPEISDAVQAAVVWSGPVRDLPGEVVPASPVGYVSPEAPPMLLVHGAEDRVVAAAQSQELHDHLAVQGAPVTLRIVPGADHRLVGVGLAPPVTESLAHFTSALRR